MKRLLTLKK
jgi:saccharopine dehydrogenase (NADP+, L-glutamate forming)